MVSDIIPRLKSVIGLAEATALSSQYNNHSLLYEGTVTSEPEVQIKIYQIKFYQNLCIIRREFVLSVVDGSADVIINGLLEEPALAFDPQITVELQGRLFRGQELPVGLDLLAISVQRGRDHGTVCRVEDEQSHIRLCVILTLCFQASERTTMYERLAATVEQGPLKALETSFQRSISSF